VSAAAVFAEWQPRYAEHGIATFPIEIVGKNKKPATRGYMKTGIRGSGQLVLKFPDAMALGCICGKRNRLTVVDLDDTDKKIIEEGERLFGTSPLLWRTGGGKFAMAFRYNGEARRIRPIPGLPIDLLGGGVAVLPPSAGVRQPYEIIRGSLADLDRLPVARIPDEIANTNAPLPPVPTQPRDTISPAALIPDGNRGEALFRHCRSAIAYCADLDQLKNEAKTWAARRLERGADPVTEAEIEKTCRSVWMYRGGRRNMVVAGPFLETDQLHRLERDPEALALFAYLSMRQGKGADFIIANGLADALGWGRRSIPTARKLFLDLKIIKCVRPARPGEPALYRWAIPHE
jgi:hypothetical protein